MQRKIVLYLSIAPLLLVLAAGQQSGAGPSSQNGVTVQENVAYATVKGTELHLDVYEPSDRGTQTRPAVVLLHGGGWTGFDKSTMRGMGQFLARSGFVAFAVDYRLLHGDENRWPAQLDDVQRAVRWVRANAAKYGVNAEHIGASATPRARSWRRCWAWKIHGTTPIRRWRSIRAGCKRWWTLAVPRISRR